MINHAGETQEDESAINQTADTGWRFHEAPKKEIDLLTQKKKNHTMDNIFRISCKVG